MTRANNITYKLRQFNQTFRTFEEPLFPPPRCSCFSNFGLIDLIIINLYLRFEQSLGALFMSIGGNCRQHEMFTPCTFEVIPNCRIVLF